MKKTLAAFLTGLLAASILAGIFAFEQVALAQDQNGTEITLTNGMISRVIRLDSHGPVTTSLVNRLSGTEYLWFTRDEFRLELSRELTGDNQTAELRAENFWMTGYRWQGQSGAQQQLEVELRGNFYNNPVDVTLFYEIQPGTNFIRKWLKVAPFQATGWVIRNAVIEDWQANPGLRPVGILQRYPELHPDGSDQVNYSTGKDPSQVDSSNSGQRFTDTTYSRQIAAHHDNNQGMYFFTESLFGSERFDGTLMLGNSDFVEPEKGFTSGKAVIGMWQGPPEIGFKRYNDYVYNRYAVVKGKKDPVWFSSWYVYENNINAPELEQVVDNMQGVGFYDVLHIDAGWEKDAPLQVNTDENKFPAGLDPLAGKLNSAGLGMGLWINPFSGHYQDITSYQPFREQHPDWIASDGVRICPLSGAGQYIRNRLLEIAHSWPLKALYWDGADWNISGCDSPDQGWRTPAEEHILTLKFFASLLDELHAIQPDLRVIVWSAPPDIHWLSAADQVQLSDIDTPPIGVSELVRRQQIYHASFLQPATTIWGDWYGLGYRRNWDEGLGLPLNRLEYAEMSQLGNGATQAGGSYALPYAPPELTEFVAKMFAFRKHFSDYFNQYQHILGFPDGYNVEGEAHLKNGKGFILLYNPGQEEQTINLPLDEPELELTPGQYYELTDWSELTASIPLGATQPGDYMPVSIPAQGWKVIGLDIPLQEALIHKGG